jgi:hypothetical protein
MISGTLNKDIHPYQYLLETFAGDQRNIAYKYLKQIDYDGGNDYIIQCLGAVVTHIVKQIIDKDGAGRRYVEPELYEYLLMMIDVKKITERLIDYCENFMPIATPYLKNLDSQAELCLLFCNNYVFGLIEKIRYADEKVIRMLKLKKLNEIDNV